MRGRGGMAFSSSARKDPEDKRIFVEALARGLDVLRCFNPSDHFLGIQEIVFRTKLPKTTVARLIHTLLELSYLSYSKSLGKYFLGDSVTVLGLSKLAQMDIRRVSRPLMQALAEYTQASVTLGMRDQLNMIYIDTYRNYSTFAVQLDVGSQIPISITSMGKAYLSALSEEKRAELMEQIRESDEENWPIIKENLDSAIQDYQRLGFCMSISTWRKEINGVAVPLVINDGTIMVFSCTGPSFMMTSDVIENDFGPRLINLVGNVRTSLALSKT